MLNQHFYISSGNAVCYFLCQECVVFVSEVKGAKQRSFIKWK